MTDRGYLGVNGILIRSALNCRLLEEPVVPGGDSVRPLRWTVLSPHHLSIQCSNIKSLFDIPEENDLRGTTEETVDASC